MNRGLGNKLSAYTLIGTLVFIACIGSPFMTGFLSSNPKTQPIYGTTVRPSLFHGYGTEYVCQEIDASTEIFTPIRFTDIITPTSITTLQYEGATSSSRTTIPWALAPEPASIQEESTYFDVESVLSSELVDALEGSDSSDLLRVIIILKEQPQWEDAERIKEQARVNAESVVCSFSPDSQEYTEAMKFETRELRRDLYDNARSLVQPVQNRLSENIVELGGSILHRYAFVNGLAAELTPVAIRVLEDNPDIMRISLDGESSLCLDISVPTTRAQYWYDLGYDGSGVNVAILDTGVDGTHPALSGRVIHAKSFVSETTDPDDDHYHGTHVAGIVASNDPFIRGIAPGASIINAKVAYDHNGDGNPTLLDADVIAGAEWAIVNASADIINLSAEIGYNTERDCIDAMVSYYDIVWVNSAGNDGPGSGTVNNVGYNSITVGSMKDYNTTSRVDDTLSTWSSRGPASNGRIKPDLVAPGADIVSTYSDWEDIWLSDFVSLSGTSMASPHVAGAVALLYDWVISSNTERYKALLMNSAVDYPTLDSGLDNDYGAGYMSLQWASLIRDYIFMGSLSDDEDRWYKIYLDAEQFVKATIVWERPGIYNPVNNQPDLDTISNLDLYIYAPDGSIIDSSTSGVDNVEQVWMGSAPVNGEYLIRVHATSVYGDIGTQVYALSSYGGTERAYAPEILTATINDAPVIDGANGGAYTRTQSFKTAVEVEDGDASPTDLTVELNVNLPNGTHFMTSPMTYNASSDKWEITMGFGLNTPLGDWSFTITAYDEYDIPAEPYSFTITCLNEEPEILGVILSSTEFRRANETLHITVDALDFSDGTNLTLYLNVTKPDLSTDWYLMQQNPINELFYLNLTLPENAPLGAWTFFVSAVDKDGGVVVSTEDTFDVLTHQYLLTVISPHSEEGIVVSGTGIYDAGTEAYASLSLNYTPGSGGIREGFTHWSGDATGTNYSQSDPILMDGIKTVYAEWDIQYYLNIQRIWYELYITAYGEGWYWANSIAYAGQESGIYVFPDYTNQRVAFTNWAGDATGTDYTQSDPILMDGPKEVQAEWKGQFRISIFSPYGALPAFEWADGGEEYQISAKAPADVVINESRWVCIGYRIEDGELVASQTCVIYEVDMAYNITFEWIQQFHLTTVTIPLLDPAPTINPTGEWFDVGTSVTITAQNVPGFAFTNWVVNGIEHDPGIASVLLIMNESYIAEAYYSEIAPTSSETTTSSITTTSSVPTTVPDATLSIVIALVAVGAIITIIIIYQIWKRRGS